MAQSRRTEYENWLRRLIAMVRVLDIDEQSSQLYAEIRLELKKIGRPIPSNDIWIAALCRQHSYPLLSRDRHFDLVKGLTRIGW
jgi:tRNA(fMet)-specific endonuclease VapC